MLKRILWIVIVILAILIGLYPVMYFVLDPKFGLLSTKEDVVLNSILWNSAFYIHIVLGGIALLIGWIQFNARLRERYLKTHQIVGKIYVVSVILSAITGLYIALYATGGTISKAGFTGLSLVWFYTTFQGYQAAVKKKIKQHQMLMIYSYAACFAAVTLRIWLPLLVNLLGDFIPAYRIVSWLCWVPNLMVAFLIVRQKNLHQSV